MMHPPRQILAIFSGAKGVRARNRLQPLTVTESSRATAGMATGVRNHISGRKPTYQE
jgi:hypothetical protein